MTLNPDMQIKNMLGGTADYYSADYRIGGETVTLSWLISVSDSQKISEQLLVPLASSPIAHAEPEAGLDQLLRVCLPAATMKQAADASQAITLLLQGYVLLRRQGSAVWQAVEAKAEHYRSITEPSTETIVRGPKEGFTESANTVIGILRRRIRNPRLRFEKFTAGKESNTTLYVAYVDGIASGRLLEELRSRVKKMEVAAIHDSGNVEELISDQIWTPFPLMYSSERPDSVASHLLEGKAAVIVEGSPFVLTVPATFQDFFQASEDYYEPFMMSSLVRIIRYFSFMLALLLPSIYVALITFHQEMIPTDFLLNIMAQREGIPFPAVVETLIMEITFEVLREAGIRMPRAIGATVSIVGGLVIGQAAVEAGIISNIMVIIVALTAIASFVTPIYRLASSTRLLRFVIILLAGTLGMYGVLLGLIAMILHLTSLRSFGVPYLSPIAPMQWKQFRDVFVRLPLTVLRKRSRSVNPQKPQP